MTRARWRRARRAYLAWRHPSLFLVALGIEDAEARHQ